MRTSFDEQFGAFQAFWWRFEFLTLHPQHFLKNGI